MEQWECVYCGELLREETERLLEESKNTHIVENHRDMLTSDFDASPKGGECQSCGAESPDH